MDTHQFFTLLPPDRSDSACNEDRHGKSFVLVMRLELNQFSFLLWYSARNGGGRIRQEANIHKAVINARILDHKVLIGPVPKKAFKIRNHFQSNTLLHGKYANILIYVTGRHLQPRITINSFLRFLGIVLRFDY